MTPGQPFNPRFTACNFHPEEIVARRRDLSDGQKWLYDRMVRWARSANGERPNERAGQVWRSQKNMAEELGKSERQIRRDVAKLEKVGLIRHLIRDGRNSNTYAFLFDAAFERTPVSSQGSEEGEFDRTSVSSQTASDDHECPPARGHQCPLKTDLTGHQCPPNQKAFNQEKESSSEKLSGPAARPTTSSRHSKEIPDGWWTQAEFDAAKEAMAKHRGSGERPDTQITARVLANLSDFSDFDSWIADLRNRFPGGKVQSWGFYEMDARTIWPARRAEAAKLAAAERSFTPADLRRQEEEEAKLDEQFRAERRRKQRLDDLGLKRWRDWASCDSCLGYGYNPETAEVCTCIAGQEYVQDLELERTKCLKCNRQGYVPVGPDAGGTLRVEWCTCVNATEKRARRPGLLADAEEERRQFPRLYGKEMALSGM